MEKIKIYFDNGQLKVRIPECDSIPRHDFLYDTYHIFKEWTDEQGVMLVQVESQWKHLIAYAKRWNHAPYFELTQDVEDYYAYQVETDDKKAERKRIEEERKQAIESANNRQRRGCGMCIHLEYANAHWEEVDGVKVWVGGKHYCKYAMEVCRYKSEDVEYEFEYYKANRYYNPPPGYNPPAFVAQPFPCAGCEYLEKANKAWEDINKEKEKDV